MPEYWTIRTCRFDPLQQYEQMRISDQGGEFCTLRRGPNLKRRKLKKKVVAGTVHWGRCFCSYAGTLLFTYCKYSAVTVSD